MRSIYLLFPTAYAAGSRTRSGMPPAQFVLAGCACFPGSPGQSRLALISNPDAFPGNLGNLGLLSEVIWAIWACFQGDLGNLGLLS